MADELEGTPTPEPAPEPTPAPTEAPPAAPPAPADTPAEPEPPAETSGRIIDDRVPYPRFRQVQTEATQYRRTLQQQRAEYDALRGRAATLEEQLRQREEALEDHRALASIIQEDPELYETVTSRIQTRGGGARPTAQPATRGPASRPAPSDDLTRMVYENNEWMRQQREQLAADQSMAHKERLYTTVQGQVHDLLQRSGYTDPKVLPDLVPEVIDFVVTRGGQVFEDTGTLEDVPWLFNQWLKGQLAAEQAKSSHRIAAHSADARRPVPVPGGQIAPNSPRPHAVGSAEIREQAMRVLREQGWGEHAA